LFSGLLFFMAAHKKDTTKIRLNLLHPQGMPEKLPVKFLKWLLLYGRYIVIVVEIVVLAAFVARFKLDSDLANLKDQIKTVAIPKIKGEQKTEQLIVLTQLQFDAIKTVYAKTPNWKQILSTISSKMPSSIRLNSLGFDNSTGKLQFKLAGESSTNGDLAAFLQGLKSDDKTFADVTLSNVSFDQGSIVFSISGALK
jgi:hypothetical protein